MDDAKPKKKRDPVIKWTIIVCGILLVLACAVSLWHLILSSRVDRRLAAIRAQGYPITLRALNEWYPAVPDSENAALVYVDAFSKLDNKWSTEDRNLPFIGNMKLLNIRDMPADIKAQAFAYLKQNEEAIPLLHQAASLMKSRYPIDLRGGRNLRLDHVALSRHAARILCLGAILQADADKADEAADSILCAFAVTQSLAQEPVHDSAISRMITYRTIGSALELTLSRTQFTDSKLIALSDALARAEDKSAIRMALAGELSFGISDMDNINVYVALAMGGGALSGFQRMTAGLKGEIAGVTGLRKLDEAAFLDLMKDALTIADLPVEERQSAVRNKLSDGRIRDLPQYCHLTRYVIPYLPRLFIEDAVYIAHIRTARAGLAIERYRGKHAGLPDTLDALVPEFIAAIPLDPFDGKPLRYTRTEKGYIVYSIGQNMTDDGGLAEEPATPGKASRELDIVFAVERQLER